MTRSSEMAQESLKMCSQDFKIVVWSQSSCCHHWILPLVRDNFVKEWKAVTL
jgi:hypothetical protein